MFTVAVGIIAALKATTWPIAILFISIYCLVRSVWITWKLGRMAMLTNEEEAALGTTNDELGMAMPMSVRIIAIGHQFSIDWILGIVTYFVVKFAIGLW